MQPVRLFSSLPDDLRSRWAGEPESPLERVRAAAGAGALVARDTAGRARELALLAADHARELAAEHPEAQRMASAVRDALPLERLPGFRRRSAWERFTHEQAPAWTLALAALTGFSAGISVGLVVAARRTRPRAAAQALEARADEIKAAWPDVTDEDIRRARGRADRLAETIRARTGEAADKILAQIEGLTPADERAPNPER